MSFRAGGGAPHTPPPPVNEIPASALAICQSRTGFIGSKKSGELRRQLMSGAAVSDLNEVEGRDAGPIVSEGGAKSLMDIGKGLTKAMEDKNRLISYDKDRYSKNLHK